MKMMFESVRKVKSLKEKKKGINYLIVGLHKCNGLS